MRLLVINPNNNERVTRRIADSAKSVEAPGDAFVTVSAPSGIDLIVTEEDQLAAEESVAACAASYADRVDGIVIASFGDTGIDLVRDRVDVPVVGIAHAAMSTALDCGPRVAIISFSEEMRPSFLSMLRHYDIPEETVDVCLLPAEPLPDAGDIQDVLFDKLKRLAEEAAADGASCIVPGGGPLAGLADRLRPSFEVPIVDGTQAAIGIVRQHVESHQA